MKRVHKILLFVLLAVSIPVAGGYAIEPEQKETQKEEKEMDVREFILEHVSDSYVWHITKIGEHEIGIPLPVILYSKTTGWHVFMSSVFHENPVYEGFQIVHEGKYKGKIVEMSAAGEEVRPFDISITKNVFALLFSSILMIFCIMYVARSYKKNPLQSKSGFAGFMELFIMNINDDVIKPCIGKGYEKYAPYLLTVFFFVFTNNILGLIPIFPGGANVTGNIAITFVLALITFLIVNISGSKEYWKEIFWPDVPLWLKVPPMLPIIEMVGIFTKPFALMIRLFANMIAGHSMLAVFMMFIVMAGWTASLSYVGTMSVFASVFVSLLELLVGALQAYIFTFLSAIFIGLYVEPAH